MPFITFYSIHKKQKLRIFILFYYMIFLIFKEEYFGLTGLEKGLCFSNLFILLYLEN